MPDLAALDYGAMRLLRLRVVLVSFLKRWGVGLAIVFALFAAGSDAPLTIAAGLAGTLLVPLAWAAGHGAWIVAATGAYAIAGIAPVVVSRSLWWPTAWAEAERALPLDPAAVRRSDRLVAAIIGLPLQVVLLVGVIGIVATDDDRGAAWAIAVGWLVAALASLRGSVAWMTRIRARHGGRPTARHRDRLARPAHSASAIRRLDARMAVIALPLARGRARRSACVLVGGMVATGASATVSAWSGVPVAWSLAMHAFCALVATSVGSDATRRELQPLWTANPALPMPRASCERWRNGVVLVPSLVGVVASGITAIVAVVPAVPGVRLVPLAAYGTSVVVGSVVEALVRRTSATEVRAARWLLTLSVCIACASEVT